MAGRAAEVSAPQLGPGRGVKLSRAAADSPVLVTRVGLKLPPNLTYEGWERAGRRLAGVVDSSAWCLGDWVVHGEREYEDRYRRAVDAVGLDYQTIRNYAWVARRFPIGRRRSALSLQHHAEVARLSDEEQDAWLDRAEQGKWSRNTLRSHIKALRAGGEPPESRVPLPRIETEPARLERWRAAADRASCSLTQWIVASLDQASAVG
jgi:hypothetical protein